MAHGTLDVIKVVIDQGEVLLQILQVRQMQVSIIKNLLVFTLVGDLFHAHNSTRLCHLVLKSLHLPCQLLE